MIIQHNMSAMNTNNALKKTELSKQKSTERLSSGYRINRSADNAAGLSVSEKMRAQIRGLNQAAINTQDAISLIQTADGALSETHSIMQRMRELAVQAANDTNVSADRQAIQMEIDNLAIEIDRISTDTEFNTMKIWDGSFSDKKFQVGANSVQMINATFCRMDTHAFGFTIAYTLMSDSDWDRLKNAQVNVSNIDKTQPSDIGYAGWYVSLSGASSSTRGGNYAESADVLMVNNSKNAGHTLMLIDGGITMVSQMRAHLGAMQNRLEHALDNANNMSENLTAAESRIRDANMADEMVKFSKDDILSQAAQAMLAQANQSTQGILSLLR